MQVKRNNSIRLYIAATLIGLCVLSCTHGHKPDDAIPNLINDTGINVTVSFNPNGGYWNKPEQTEVRKIIGNAGDTLLFTDVPQQNANMVFAGWNKAGGTVPAAFPTRAAVYTAVWRPPNENEAPYTVRHERENLENDQYSIEDIEKRYGIIGQAVQTEPKSYAGFDYYKDGSGIPQTIEADGGTIAVLKYLRKRVTLTFNLDGGTTTTPLTGGNSLTGKCGEPLTVAAPTKAGKIFNGWNTVGGTLPVTFPDANKTYKALWHDEGNPPVQSPENLIKNADFSKLKDETGKYKAYWGNTNPKSPASWNTWASVENTADVTFKVEAGIFIMTAAATPLVNAGIQQPITLPDVNPGTKYMLKAHIKLTASSGANGNGLIKLQNKWLLSQGGGEKDFECEITVVEGNKITFKDKDGDKTENLTGTDKNQIKIELFASNLKNKSVSFSNLTLTKE